VLTVVCFKVVFNDAVSCLAHTASVAERQMDEWGTLVE